MAAATPVLLLMTLLSVALNASATTTSIPASIEVPKEPPYKLQQSLQPRGFQYYRFNGTSWVGFNASARLYISENQKMARHFFLTTSDAHGGQPSWESVSVKKNGAVPFEVPYSRVTDKAVSEVTVGKDSVPWVLLKSTQAKGR